MTTERMTDARLTEIWSQASEDLREGMDHLWDACQEIRRARAAEERLQYEVHRAEKVADLSVADATKCALDNGTLTIELADLRTENAALRAHSADDLRAAGWSVAVHNDYSLNGEAFTFWLFTKDGQCLKGEGRTDAIALNAVREQIASHLGVVEG